jgi:hypothetical protein
MGESIEVVLEGSLENKNYSLFAAFIARH